MNTWVVAYFESNSHAQIAGIFPSEGSYNELVEALEQLAEDSNMILTESCGLSWEEVTELIK